MNYEKISKLKIKSKNAQSHGHHHWSRDFGLGRASAGTLLPLRLPTDDSMALLASALSTWSDIVLTLSDQYSLLVCSCSESWGGAKIGVGMSWRWHMWCVVGMVIDMPWQSTSNFRHQLRLSASAVSIWRPLSSATRFAHLAHSLDPVGFVAAVEVIQAFHVQIFQVGVLHLHRLRLHSLCRRLQLC